MAHDSTMGCPFSLLRRLSRTLRRRNDITDRAPSEKVPVTINNDIQTDMNPLVVFILGGPGSRKGVFIDCLTSCFHFTYVPCFDEPNVDRNQLERILSRLASEIATKDTEKYTERYLVDIMIENRRSCFDWNCSQFLEVFEKEFPIGCAINLVVDSPTSSVNTLSRAERGDEVDGCKLQKRAVSHRNSIKHLLHYFESRSKLISMDLSSSPDQVIWKIAYKVLCHVKVKANRCTHLLIVFNNGEFSNEDSFGKSFKKIDLASDLQSVESPTMQDCLETVGRLVDEKSPCHSSFLVDIRDTPLNQPQVKSSTKATLVMFQDDGAEFKKEKLAIDSFKAITSVCNETFVFPCCLEDPLCLRMAQTLSASRRMKSKRKGSQAEE